jgi:LuxR family quorum sensing-dependent transcriptional regulator
LSGIEDDCAARALDFVESLDECTDQSQVARAVESILSEFGFEHYVITGLPNPNDRLDQLLVIHRLPDGWYEHYAGRNYMASDPVFRNCRATTTPFEWGEAPYDPEADVAADEVMKRARDFGMNRGFSVPIHGPDGYEACFSMSGRTPDLSGRTKPAMHMVAMYAFERARLVARKPLRNVTNPLTKREQEVLTWAALGKSARDTAEILRITERTAVAHTVNATHKLGAANRTQAVVRAMQSKFIRV